MEEPVKSTAGPTPRGSAAREVLRRPRVRVGAVIALAAAAGLLAWVVIDRGGNSSNPAVPTASASLGDHIGPIGLSAQGLATLAHALKKPIYWAGPKAGYTYELTRTRDGKIYVRYLPSGVKVGDRRANFLIVATYPYAHAFRALKAISNGKGVTLPDGGFALPDPNYPKSVHLAYRGVNYEVEVYDPSPAQSQAAALSGQVQPVS